MERVENLRCRGETKLEKLEPDSQMQRSDKVRKFRDRVPDVKSEKLEPETELEKLESQMYMHDKVKTIRDRISGAKERQDLKS